MKKIFLTIIAALFAVSSTADLFAQDKKTQTVVFQTDIHCQNCKKKLEDSIPFEKGVRDMKVDVATKKVTVTFDPSKTDSGKIAEAINKRGYQVEVVPEGQTNVPAEK